MTRRRRHSKTNPLLRGIDKPHENPASYPPPEERLRIIARREELTKALINLRVQGKLGESRVNELIAEYGANEVLHVSLVLQSRFQSSEFLVDEPRIYRHYRLGFARFGGTRRFLSQREQEELSFERAMLYAQREFKSLIKRKPSPRELELGKLVMMDWHFWDDITPPPHPIPRPRLLSSPGAGISIRIESPANMPRGNPTCPIWSALSSMKPCATAGPASLPVGRHGMRCIYLERCAPLTAPADLRIYITARTTGCPTFCPKSGRKWAQASNPPCGTFWTTQPANQKRAAWRSLGWKN